MATETKKIKKDATLKQSNNLTVARYTLTLTEQKLMFAICSQIEKNDESFDKVRFSIAGLAELCNIDGKGKYEDIRSAGIKLLSRLVRIPTTDGGEYITHWIQSQRYYKDDCTIEFKIDEGLHDELLQLKKAYIDTPVSMLTSFRKKYSSRMYLILKKMLKVGEFEYSLDFFRDVFQLSNTYKKFSNIKNGVLEPTLKELNESSDLHIDYEYIREGRSFTKIKFSIKLKNDKNNKNGLDEKSLLSEYNLTKEEQKIFDLLISSKWKITPEIACKLIHENGIDCIERNIRYSKKTMNDRIFNPAGFLITMILRDTAKEEQKRQEILDKKEDNQIQTKIVDGKEVSKITVDGEELIINMQSNEKSDKEENELTQFEINYISKYRTKVEQNSTKTAKKINEKLAKIGITIKDVLLHHQEG